MVPEGSSTLDWDFWFLLVFQVCLDPAGFGVGIGVGLSGEFLVLGCCTYCVRCIKATLLTDIYISIFVFQ